MTSERERGAGLRVLTFGREQMGHVWAHTASCSSTSRFRSTLIPFGLIPRPPPTNAVEAERMSSVISAALAEVEEREGRLALGL